MPFRMFYIIYKIELNYLSFYTAEDKMIQTKIVFYSPSKNIIAISPHVVVRKEELKQIQNVLQSKTKSYWKVTADWVLLIWVIYTS